MTGSGPAANSAVSASAAGSSWSSGWTSLTRPQSSARAESTRSPSRAIWNARALPTAAGTNRVEPPSGIRPMFTNARPKKADSAASTMSHASASEQPMPTAGPFTAATTGFSSRRMPAMIGW